MLLKMEGIDKSFDEKHPLLEGISFVVDAGDFVGIVGQNGAGKSTILKMLNGLLPFDKGELLFDGRSYSDLTPRQKRVWSKEVCYIFQNANLLGNQTVNYHLNLVYRLEGKRPDKAKIAEICRFMGIEQLRKQRCQSLSGGQAQKVAIAMALLGQAKVLLCDEISAALDATSEAEIFELLQRLNQKEGLTVIMISHNLSLIKKVCRRVLFLEDGHISKELKPAHQESALDASDYYDFAERFLQA